MSSVPYLAHAFRRPLLFVLCCAAVAGLMVLAASSANAQPRAEDLTTEGVDVPAFYAYDPPSTLVVPETPVTRAKYPFIDVHNHQSRMPEQDLGELVAAMDELNMEVMVNLSGRGFRRIEQPDGSFSFGFQEPEYLGRAIEKAREEAPGRFVVFTNVDFSGVGSEGWAEAAVAQLEKDVAAGAAGLKIYKGLGLTTEDVDGKRIPTDDPRLDPIWAKCGELGIPVLIHTGEPAPFWMPKDDQNERLLELLERPNRYRDPAVYPSWEEIMGEQHNLFRRHPETVFINAHLGWLGNDLAKLGELLDELPNVYTEIGAVLAELGRQPRFARQFLTEYQDRVMFGKDSWNPEEYHTYFRVLETDDEYFPYYRRRHAFWRMYGLDLPDEVLKKLYYKNALKVIPGIDPAPFPD
ncbi:MAG: amidohydrolase family protein [Acidobacteriota bacterium]|nr:amidohydrolase family protein [Acidobacteriota bacterium]